MTGLMNCLTTERNSCVNVWFWNLVAPPWSLSTSVDSCSSPGSSSKASQIYIISSLTSDDSIFLQITGNYLFCLKVINGLEYSFSLKIIHWQRPIKIWVNNNFLFNGFILEHIHNLALYLGYYNYKRNKSENDPFPVDSPCFTLYVKQTVSLFQKTFIIVLISGWLTLNSLKKKLPLELVLSINSRGRTTRILTLYHDWLNFKAKQKSQFIYKNCNSL